MSAPDETPEQSPFGMPARVLLLIVAVAALAGGGVAWIAYGSSPDVASAQPALTTTTSAAGGITVNGEGTVSVVPTQSQWSFSTSVTNANASQAFALAGQKAQAMTGALKKAGVADKDIQTSSISLSPNYKTTPAGSQSGVESYTASFSITVQSAVKDAGAVVNAAVSAGANEIDGPSLSAGDSEALYRQALAAAIDQAKGRAETAAKAAGVTLGAPSAIDTTQNGPVVFAGAQSVSPKAANVPISPGETQVTADVTVTYAIG
jgi:hypothetical protein